MPPSNSQKTIAPTKRPPVPLINEEADHELSQIMLRYGRITLIVAMLLPFPMAFVNMKGSPVYPIHRLLDTVSAFILLLPFFIGMKKLFDARLRIGRELVQARKWRPAITALEPFSGVTQRFLDGTGEAHYLLVLAYEAAGDRPSADRARRFLQSKRPGPWTEKLKGGESPGIAGVTRKQEKKPAAPNTKRRRRF